MQTFWLGRWARAYELSQDGQVSVGYWLGLYSAWVMLGFGATGSACAIFYVGSIRASREIHKRLVDLIFGSYVRFLDTTPVGRIVGRFTKDMKSIDGAFVEVSVGWVVGIPEVDVAND